MLSVAFIFLSLIAVGAMFYSQMSQRGKIVVRVEYGPKVWNSVRKALSIHSHDHMTSQQGLNMHKSERSKLETGERH